VAAGPTAGPDLPVSSVRSRSRPLGAATELVSPAATDVVDCDAEVVSARWGECAVEKRV